MNSINLKKTLPLYFLLILLPAIFGLILYFTLSDLDRNQEINDILASLSERATEFTSKTTPADFFKPFFLKFSENIFQYIENPKKNTEQIIKEVEFFKTNLGENARCAVFNNKAELINSKQLLNHEARFFTYAWKKIHRIPNASYNEISSDRNLIMGWEFNDELMRDKPELCIPTSSLGKNGVFFFKNAKSFYNGILIFVEYKRTGKDFIEAKINDFSTHELPIILYDSKTKQRKNSMSGHEEITYEKTNTNEFLDGFVKDNTVWRGFKSDNYKLLFGQIIKNPNKYKNKKTVAVVLFCVILIAGSVFFFKNVSNRSRIFISIRYKLIIIFALAIYMPTLALWILSYTSLNDHRTAIENNTKKGMLDILNKIDTDYKKEEEDIEDRFIKFDNYLNSFKGKKAPSRQEVDLKVRELCGNYRRAERFNWADVRHINQSQIYTTLSEKSNKQLEKFGKYISLLCLGKYCPERLEYAGIKPTISDEMVGNLLENPISGLATLFERPKEIVNMKFEGISTKWWWNYFPEKDNPIAFYICNATARFSNSAYFRNVIIKRHALGNVNLKLITFQYTTQQFIPEITQNEYSKNLLSLIEIANVNKTVETATINYENNQYLCLCMPGSNLKECFVLCLYPVSKIDRQINDLQADIYSLMILLFIIAILTSSLLAKNFILPIKELNRGLEALRKRETSTIITIENKDELGHLGHAFNQMMTDIKDMLLASAVQQCLIPTGKYEIDGYDCILYNQMATDVGGDYADIFELPNDRLLIVIGDVTGHGVSSSLLTAMVKASVFRFASKDTPLNEIVTKTSDMICDLLNKKKLMTFCAIVLDKKTGEMSVCNAGHPYPIIKEKEPGIIRMPSKTSIPMGISKKRGRYTSESEKINEGETLFLYTDGFPEAENEKGEEYSYERFNQLIANMETTSSENYMNELLKNFIEYHGDKELADDLTFIILRRTSS